MAPSQVTGRRVLLEIAIGSVEDALTAQAGGADRLELNSALPLGGLTPSLGLVNEVCAACSLPVIAMLRPRAGGCHYSQSEFRVMRRDLDLLLAVGVAGVAMGILTPTGEVDLVRCREIVQACAGVPVIFHRAFDLTPDPMIALQQLIDLGIRRIMTSGQEETASRGIPLLKELIVAAGRSIEILPAGGINALNVDDILQRTGCSQIHAGLRHWVAEPSGAGRPRISFGSAKGTEGQIDATDPAAVVALRARLG